MLSICSSLNKYQQIFTRIVIHAHTHTKCTLADAITSFFFSFFVFVCVLSWHLIQKKTTQQKKCIYFIPNDKEHKYCIKLHEKGNVHWEKRIELYPKPAQKCSEIVDLKRILCIRICRGNKREIVGIKSARDANTK